METIIHEFGIQTSIAQLALRQHLCASQAKEFEAGTLTVEQKAALAHRWDDILKETYVLQLMLDLLERKEKEERGDGAQVSRISRREDVL